MTKAGKTRVRVLVVCPTEFGGQLEHAMDTALAVLGRHCVSEVILLSRPGAAAYVGRPEIPGLRIIESIPPSRQATNYAWQEPIRAALQVKDLIQEHIVIRQAARSATDETVLVLDSSKYPWPRVLKAQRRQPIVLFAHNARPHFTYEEASLRQKFILFLEKSCLRRVDRVITHGHAQEQIIRKSTKTDVVSVRLPRSTRLDRFASHPSHGPQRVNHTSSPAAPFALCIGEIRSNKGIEQAIEAATFARVSLRVYGRSENEQLGNKIAQLATKSGIVYFEDRFLEREEFNSLLACATVVVLPYLHFDAESGVLSKAMHVGAKVLASDLPALRDQAGNYPNIKFTDIRDLETFGIHLRTAVEDEVQTSAQTASGMEQADHKDWDAVVDAVLGVKRYRGALGLIGR